VPSGIVKKFDRSLTDLVKNREILMQQEIQSTPTVAESEIVQDNNNTESSRDDAIPVLTVAPQHKRLGSQRVENESVIIQDPISRMVSTHEPVDFRAKKVSLLPKDQKRLKSSSLSLSSSRSQQTIQRILEDKSRPIEDNLRLAYEKTDNLINQLIVIQYAVAHFWELALYTRASIQSLVEQHPEPNLYGWNHKFHNLYNQTSQTEEKIYIAEQAQELWGKLLFKGKKPHQVDKIYAFGVKEKKQWTQRYQPLFPSILSNSGCQSRLPSDGKVTRTAYQPFAQPEPPSTITVAELLAESDDILLRQPLPSANTLESAYEDATTPEQKIQAIVEAIDNLYSQATPRTLQGAEFRFIQTPAYPKQELRQWIQRLDHLYISLNDNPRKQLALITSAQSCWLKLQSTSTPETLEEKSYFFRSTTQEKLSSMSRDSSREDISLASPNSENTTPSPRITLASRELEKWRQRLLALEAAINNTTSLLSCCCLIS
jgi:hypothetical protein